MALDMPEVIRLTGVAWPFDERTVLAQVDWGYPGNESLLGLVRPHTLLVSYSQPFIPNFSGFGYRSVRLRRSMFCTHK